MEGADVNNAYLYGNMDKLTIRKQLADSFGKPRYLGKVCFVVKSLYDTWKVRKICGSYIRKQLWIENFASQRSTNALIFLLVDRTFSF